MIESILSILGNFVINVISQTGYLGITFLMAIESAAIPLPSEIVMPFSGYLVAEGKFNFWWVSLLGAVGNVIGSMVAYWIGAWGGRPLVEKYGKYIFIRKHEIERADRWFQNYGQSTVFFSRLLPAVRTFISLPAGIAKMDLMKFIFYTFAGSLPWSILLTYVGYKLGGEWENVRGYFHKFDIVIGVVIMGMVGWWIINKVKIRSQSKI